MTPSTTTPKAGSFAALFEASVAKADSLKEGEIVSGTIIALGKDNVVVDIGYKSEGVIPMYEFIGPGGEAQVKVGEVVDVLVESKESDVGLVLLSKEKADRLKVWDEISAARDRDELIQGTITARVKGGLSVTIRGGVKAFLPGSQVDLRPVRNLDKLLGQTFDFKVIKFHKQRGNIVVSRRVLLEKERDELKARTLQNLEEGMVVTGVIKNITEYGAFVDLGGIDGLLHITDMSWGRVAHPSEVFQVGDEVTVKVLKYNAETERVSLGLKQTIDDPWNTAAERYPVEMKVSGKVVSITDYGAFVELEPGVEGLVHVSEMSWTKKVKSAKGMVNLGDQVEAIILAVDPENRRISLGMKQITPNPWMAVAEKYQIGEIVTGIVRNVTEFGAFVELEEGIDGLVHISDFSWTKKVKHPGELYKKGDEITAKVLNVDPLAQRMSLGIKQMEPNVWELFFSGHRVGDSIAGKIARITDFGAFVDLGDGIEGLVHVSELSRKRVEDIQKEFSMGQDLTMKIVKLDPTEHRIGLSVKQYEMDLEKGDMEDAKAKGEPFKKATLADAFARAEREE